VTFFTSFVFPASISDADCDMLQSVLQASDLSKGLVLMISSGGGDGLAAERIVNTCRAYSGSGDYWVLVPGKAKSAATMICMGASKIFMSAASELGPVDPQVIRREGDSIRVYSAHSLVQGYEKLFDRAVRAKGNLEPFVMQLQKYDHREIQNYKSAISLAESISAKILKSGMCKGKSIQAISNKLKMFTSPEAGTVVHGRPISAQEARSCGLAVEDIDVQSKAWADIYELYARTERFTSSVAVRAVESKGEAFFQPAPGRDS
jgi:ClpP class serine protease